MAQCCGLWECANSSVLLLLEHAQLTRGCKSLPSGYILNYRERTGLVTRPCVQSFCKLKKKHHRIKCITHQPRPQGVSSGYKVDRSLTLVLDHLHIQNFWIRMQIQTVWLLFKIHIFRHNLVVRYQI